MTRVTLSLSSESLQHWWCWAEWMGSSFQRTYKAVEGRNGYLSQLHHSGRGLSAHRLQVLTVIHNEKPHSLAPARLLLNVYLVSRFPIYLSTWWRIWVTCHSPDNPENSRTSKSPLYKVSRLR